MQWIVGKLSDGDLVIGEPTRQEIMKLKENQQKAQLLGIHAFLVQSALLGWLWGLPAAKALRRYGAKALRQ